MSALRIETDPGVFTGIPEMDAALEATGWLKAEQHFTAACNAARSRDDETYAREMAAFRMISTGWQSTKGTSGDRNPLVGDQ